MMKGFKMPSHHLMDHAGPKVTFNSGFLKLDYNKLAFNVIVSQYDGEL